MPNIYKTSTEILINSIVKAQATIAKIEKLDLGKLNGFAVVSFSDEEKVYNVSFRKRNLAGDKVPFITTCTCPHYEFRRQICKHMIAVSLEHNLSILALARDQIDHINKEYKKKKKQII